VSKGRKGTGLKTYQSHLVTIPRPADSAPAPKLSMVGDCTAADPKADPAYRHRTTRHQLACGTRHATGRTLVLPCYSVLVSNSTQHAPFNHHRKLAGSRQCLDTKIRIEFVLYIRVMDIKKIPVIMIHRKNSDTFPPISGVFTLYSCNFTTNLADFLQTKLRSILMDAVSAYSDNCEALIGGNESR
jgi:hypothetical protein